MKLFKICAFIVVCVTSVSSNLLQDFEDLRRIFPWEDFKVILSDYISYDPQTIAAVGLLRSDDYEVAYRQYIATKEAKDLLNFMQGAGIKADKTVNMVNAYLGLPLFKPRQFNVIPKIKPTGVEAVIANLLKEFPSKKINSILALLNIPKLQKIVLDAIAKDAAVESYAVGIVSEIAGSAEYKTIINYLDANSSYKVVSLLNMLAAYFDLPAYRPTTFELTTRIGGVLGLLQDLKNNVPYLQIINLINEKLLTSSDARLLLQYFFAAFAKFNTLVVPSVEFQRFRTACNATNIDVVAFAAASVRLIAGTQ